MEDDYTSITKKIFYSISDLDLILYGSIAPVAVVEEDTIRIESISITDLSLFHQNNQNPTPQDTYSTEVVPNLRLNVATEFKELVFNVELTLNYSNQPLIVGRSASGLITTVTFPQDTYHKIIKHATSKLRELMESSNSKLLTDEQSTKRPQSRLFMSSSSFFTNVFSHVQPYCLDVKFIRPPHSALPLITNVIPKTYYLPVSDLEKSLIVLTTTHYKKDSNYVSCSKHEFICQVTMSNELDETDSLSLVLSLESFYSATTDDSKKVIEFSLQSPQIERRLKDLDNEIFKKNFIKLTE